MAVTKGKIKAGSSFLGLFLPFKFPFLPRRYAVYVDGKVHQVSKQDDLFIGEPIRQLEGHEVEIVISMGMIIAIRGLEEIFRPKVITCYIPAVVRYLDHDFLQNTRAFMIKNLINQKIIQPQDAAIVEQWQSQAQEVGMKKG